MTQAIQITAASRLHFGMLEPGAGGERRFGGVGVMIASPRLRLRLSPAEHFSCSGPAADRVREFARQWSLSRGATLLPRCQLVVEQLPPMHAGFGVGTQLGLSVAHILNEFTAAGPVSPAELAGSVGRGARSAVGTYGFFLGGLVAESGKGESEVLAPLEARLELPAAWRWILVQPRGEGGLHGSLERQAFSALPPASGSHAAPLSAEMRERLLPAARRGDFQEFSASLFRFGYQSGLSFTAVQGGPYNGPQLAQIVDTLRSLGVSGVGQSSWGPTIFGLCPDDATARQIVELLRAHFPAVEIVVTSTCNHGAWVTVE